VFDGFNDDKCDDIPDSSLYNALVAASVMSALIMVASLALCITHSVPCCTMCCSKTRVVQAAS